MTLHEHESRLFYRQFSVSLHRNLQADSDRAFTRPQQQRRTEKSVRLFSIPNPACAIRRLETAVGLHALVAGEFVKAVGQPIGNWFSQSLKFPLHSTP